PGGLGRGDQRPKQEPADPPPARGRMYVYRVLDHASVGAAARGSRRGYPAEYGTGRVQRHEPVLRQPRRAELRPAGSRGAKGGAALVDACLVDRQHLARMAYGHRLDPEHVVLHRPTLPSAREQLADQCCNPGADLVPDLADRLDVTPGGVGYLPVLIPFAGEDRAGVAAAHRDDDISGADGVRGQDLRLIRPYVDADLGHGCDRNWVDPASWLRTG